MLATAPSEKARALVAELRAQRAPYMKLVVVKQKDALEPLFLRYLTEDKVRGGVGARCA